MNDSILLTIKKMIGISDDDTSFDVDLIVLINSALSTANQVGVGKTGFSIAGSDATWTDFLGDRNDLESVKQYIYMKVKIAFDGASMSSSLVDTFNNMIKEEEWRLNVLSENNTEG
jgi:hypothetical protein